MQVGDKVKWNQEPRGLIWLGEVTEVQGDQIKVWWDGKWGAGPLMNACDVTPFGEG